MNEKEQKLIDLLNEQKSISTIVSHYAFTIPELENLIKKNPFLNGRNLADDLTNFKKSINITYQKNRLTLRNLDPKAREQKLIDWLNEQKSISTILNYGFTIPELENLIKKNPFLNGRNLADDLINFKKNTNISYQKNRLTLRNLDPKAREQKLIDLLNEQKSIATINKYGFTIPELENLIKKNPFLNGRNLADDLTDLKKNKCNKRRRLTLRNLDPKAREQKLIDLLNEQKSISTIVSHYAFTIPELENLIKKNPFLNGRNLADELTKFREKSKSQKNLMENTVQDELDQGVASVSIEQLVAHNLPLIEENLSKLMDQYDLEDMRELYSIVTTPLYARHPIPSYQEQQPDNPMAGPGRYVPAQSPTENSELGDQLTNEELLALFE